MPRDLGLDRHQNKSPPIILTESPNGIASGSPSQSDESIVLPPEQSFIIVPPDQQIQSQASENLHPYTRPLTISDLDSCEALENAAFTDPSERATRDKFAYRLTKCGEICFGIFCTVDPSSGFKAETLVTGKPVETGRKNGAISVLLGHVIAAKTNGSVASDESMALPEDWESGNSQPTPFGHQENGRTIILHSIAILPRFQGRGLGQVLTKSYIQNVTGSGIANRLALIAHDHKIEWYEKLGFINKGKSRVQFGGGGWYDMTLDMKTPEARVRYG